MSNQTEEVTTDTEQTEVHEDLERVRHEERVNRIRSAFDAVAEAMSPWSAQVGPACMLDAAMDLLEVEQHERRRTQFTPIALSKQQLTPVESERSGGVAPSAPYSYSRDELLSLLRELAPERPPTVQWTRSD